MKVLFLGTGGQHLTKQVVFGQSVQDPGGSDEVTHGSRHGGGVHPNGHEGRPNIDVSQEIVVIFEEGTKDNGKK